MEPKTSRRSGRRIALLVVGIVLAIVALAVAAGGGTLIWADSTQKDGHGYYSTNRHEFRAPGRAITTKKIDIGTDVPEWLFGKVRIEASGKRAARPIFVGIARKEDVDSYLAGVEHAVVHDLEWDPFSVGYTRQPGTRVPAAPASQPFWAASAQGSGEQTLTWVVKSGDWSVVVMNADGSSGVDADVSVGIKVPYAIWFGIGFTVGGLALLAGAVLMIRAGARRRQSA
jgi:hypothetical protein